jgi:2-(1,2-epoxy-1,2-dihydrophenyl)acetyl-CoA isomerase
VPDSGGTYFVTRLLGYARAFEWFCVGRRLNADEAHEWGIVSEVVAADDFEARAADFAAELAARPTRAIAMTKRLLDQAAGSTLDDQLAREAQLQAAATQSEDFREGVQAFLEKREPSFKGR